MVTYMNAKNAEQYHVLFSKAAEILKTEQPSNIGQNLETLNISWDNFKIGSLNEYFAYLEDLMAVTTGDQQRFFLRLPLDEEVFSINADTRIINIPTSFARNGVGVQGDEMAEVVYFSIDRFFDSMDLARHDVNIVIQWEAKNKNKETIKGFSRNFGKDLESDPGKMIFGWPISKELTEIGGTIKFAVRFYIENTDREFTYSFTTLPAEVFVNSSLDYDLINSAVKEVDHGDIITQRVRSNAIYDSSTYEVPAIPTITTRLQVLGYEDMKIVDLPTDGTGIKLIVGAKPTTSGIIQYDWKKYAYNSNATEEDLMYDKQPVFLNEDPTAQIEYIYIEEKNDIPVDTQNRYYKRNGNVYELVNLTEFEKDTDTQTYKYYQDDNDEEIRGFELSGGNQGHYVSLFTQLSQATVHSVGKYSADIIAKFLINSVHSPEAEVGSITIPGPQKPIISFDENQKFSTDDNGVKIANLISDNGSEVTLKVKAEPGETGKSPAEVGENPQVTLKYNWKKENGEDVFSTVKVKALSSNSCPSSMSEEIKDDVKYNQDHIIKVVQNGNTITVYANDLREFLSTNPYQRDDEYAQVALDIDTGLDDITQTTWGSSQGISSNFDNTDVTEAESWGLASGHFVFWYKMNEETTRFLGDTQLTFKVGTDISAEVEYNLNEDNSELTISGLQSTELDEKYYVEVTAIRNYIDTKSNSDIYRITNSPEKPVIKYRLFNPTTQQFYLEEKDYQSQNNIVNIDHRPGTTSTLSFSIAPPAQYDKIGYIWMRVRTDSNAYDWENDAAKLQVDLDDSIADLVGIIPNPEGQMDYTVEAPLDQARKYIYSLPALGEPGPELENNGPKCTLTDDNPAGLYYCIVINELNGHVNANVSPFFKVSKNV